MNIPGANVKDPTVDVVGGSIVLRFVGSGRSPIVLTRDDAVKLHGRLVEALWRAPTALEERVAESWLVASGGCAHCGPPNGTDGPDGGR